MRTKGPPPAESFSEPLSPLLGAVVQLGQLKQLYRQGWLRRGLPPEKCESVAEHSLGVALLAMLLADQLPEGLDHYRILQLALLHDSGEVHAGDITPADKVPEHVKHARERESVAQVFGQLPQADGWIALWEEYHAGTSAEARVVRQLDRLEMALQAAVYERTEGLDPTEFLTSADGTIELPALRAILQEIQGLSPPK